MIMVRADLDDILEIEDVSTWLPRHEIIGIQIKANAHRPELKVFTVYIPPKTSPDPAMLEYFKNQSGNCILTGDVNCKHLVWGSSKTGCIWRNIP